MSEHIEYPEILDAIKEELAFLPEELQGAVIQLFCSLTLMAVI
ncbi:MAG: hypothetical protein RR335_09490 [Eubacterium sp.]